MQELHSWPKEILDGTRVRVHGYFTHDLHMFQGNRFDDKFCKTKQRMTFISQNDCTLRGIFKRRFHRRLSRHCKMIKFEAL